MANYSQLKAAIADVIKTNGTQAITGQVLQDVLNSMVSVIGANYTFAGVATPATNPGTPDQNVVYMASVGGTYTNFNGIELPAGISLLMWDGSWSSQTFFVIDDEPILNSNNLVKSGGIYNIIQTSELVASKGFHIDYNHLISRASSSDPRIYSQDDRYDLIWIPLKGNEKQIKMNNLGSGSFTYSFFSGFDTSEIDENFMSSNKYGYVPEGAVVCLINQLKTSNPNGYGKVELEVLLTDEDISLSREITDKDVLLMIYAILESGKWGTSTDFVHRALKVNAGEQYIIENRSSNIGYPVRYAFATSSIGGDGSNTDIPLVTGTSVYLIDVPQTYGLITIPEGCSYLLWYNSTSSYARVYEYLGKTKTASKVLPQNKLSDNNVFLNTFKDMFASTALSVAEVITSENDTKTYYGDRVCSMNLYEGEVFENNTKASSFANWNLLKYEVSPNTTYRLVGDSTGSNLSGIYMYYWADSDGRFINKEKRITLNEVWDYCTYSPSNARYLYVQYPVPSYANVGLSIYKVGFSASPNTNKKKIRLLSIGNSASEDALSYVPFIIKNMNVDVDIQIGILMQSSSTIQMQYENFINESEVYSFRLFNGGDSWQLITGTKSIQWALDNYEWDIIMQQGSTAYSTNLYITSLVNLISAYISYPVKFAWYQTYVRPAVSNGGENRTEEYMMELFEAGLDYFQNTILGTLPYEYMIPVGTAVENARTIATLKALGDYATNPNNTSGKGYFAAYDGVHLQEGLPCQIAAYTFVLSLLDIYGFREYSINGESTRVTAEWESGKNIPSPHGSPIASTKENCLIIQKCAIMAMKKPFEITDMNYIVNPT